MEQDTAQFLRNVADIIRTTLPIVANKPTNEKSHDDLGMEFLGPAYLILYDNVAPTDEQFLQLKEVAASVAITYRNLRNEESSFTDENIEEIGMLQLCRAFLYLWQQRIRFT